MATDIFPGTPVNDRGKPFDFEAYRKPVSGQQQARRLTPEESAIANHLGLGGVPMEAAAQLAVMIFEITEQSKLQAEQISFLQTRLNDLERTK